MIILLMLFSSFNFLFFQIGITNRSLKKKKESPWWLSLSKIIKDDCRPEAHQDALSCIQVIWCLFSSETICIRRLFMGIISLLSCSLSFGISRGTEAENKAAENKKNLSECVWCSPGRQMWCLVKGRRVIGCWFPPHCDWLAAARRLVIVWWFGASGKAFHLNAPGGYFA